MQTTLRGRRRPAFLTDSHRGMTPQKPRPAMSKIASATPSKALGVLPRLTAELGFAMAGRDVTVEVLPGAPTTIVFSSGGKLLSLMVLPVTEDAARRTLGIPAISTCDLAADAWFEEARQQDLQPPDELLAAAQQEAWGL